MKPKLIVIVEGGYLIQLGQYGRQLEYTSIGAVAERDIAEEVVRTCNPKADWLAFTPFVDLGLDIKFIGVNEETINSIVEELDKDEEHYYEIV